jgi:hypothetical protein
LREGAQISTLMCRCERSPKQTDKKTGTQHSNESRTCLMCTHLTTFYFRVSIALCSCVCFPLGDSKHSQLVFCIRWEKREKKKNTNSNNYNSRSQRR